MEQGNFMLRGLESEEGEIATLVVNARCSRPKAIRVLYIRQYWCGVGPIHWTPPNSYLGNKMVVETCGVG